MWAHVEDAAPIIAITNGVHNGTWQDKNIYAAYKAGEGLLSAHMAAKRNMIDEIEKRNGIKLDENTLTIGFARRAASYKRGDLISVSYTHLDVYKRQTERQRNYTSYK